MSSKSKLLGWDWILLFPVIIIPFWLAIIAVLNDFYVFGDLGDIGWFSAVTWHNGFDLYGTPTNPYSFFNVHIVPIFWLTNAISYILPLPKIDYWAALSGGIYALFSLGIYRLWLVTRERNSLQDRGIAVAVALATVFSAVGVQALRLPHLEMAIPALALWFFFYLSQKQFRVASIFFGLCLMIREDAGLHLFGLLLLLFVALKFTHRNELQKPIRWFAVSGLLYSIIALIVKYQFFMAMDNMAIVYSGNPPWQHLTWALIDDRLSFFLINRTYITLPFVISIAWAVYVRNPLIPLGYITALPWLIWNMMAVRINPAHLDFYYAFPFWLALAWPLIALELWQRDKKLLVPKRWPCFLLLFVSLVGWQGDRVTVYPFSSATFKIDAHDFEGNPFVITKEWGQEKAFKNFTDYFTAHQSSFAHMAMDEPMLGVVIDTNATVPWLGNWNSMHPKNLPETIVYFDGGYEWKYIVQPTLRAYSKEFSYFYKIPHTKISVASTRPLENILPQPMPFVPARHPF